MLVNGCKVLNKVLSEKNKTIRVEAMGSNSLFLIR